MSGLDRRHSNGRNTEVKEPGRVYRTFTTPTTVAHLGSWVLLGAAALQMLSAFLQAIFYRQPDLSRLLPGFQNPLKDLVPALGFRERLSLFTSSGTDLAIALLIAVAVILLAAVKRRPSGTSPEPSSQFLTLALMSSTALATLVVITNLVMIALLLVSSKAISITSTYTTNAAHAVGLLAPTLIAGGVAIMSVALLQNSSSNHRE